MKKLILPLTALFGLSVSVVTFADSVTSTNHQQHHNRSQSEVDNHDAKHRQATIAAHTHDHDNNRAKANQHASEHHGYHALAHHHDHAKGANGVSDSDSDADTDAHEHDHIAK